MLLTFLKYIFNVYYVYFYFDDCYFICHVYIFCFVFTLIIVILFAMLNFLLDKLEHILITKL